MPAFAGHAGFHFREFAPAGVVHYLLIGILANVSEFPFGINEEITRIDIAVMFDQKI